MYVTSNLELVCFSSVSVYTNSILIRMLGLIDSNSTSIFDIHLHTTPRGKSLK